MMESVYDGGRAWDEVDYVIKGADSVRFVHNSIANLEFCFQKCVPLKGLFRGKRDAFVNGLSKCRFEI